MNCPIRILQGKPRRPILATTAVVLLLLTVAFNGLASHDSGSEPQRDYGIWTQGTEDYTAACGGIAGKTTYTFSQVGNRSVETTHIDLRDGGSVSFYLKASSGAPPCEAVDDGDELVLEFSTDYGATWTHIRTYSRLLYNTLTHVDENIPAGAQHTQTMLRWRQISHDGEGFDVWVLSDIFVSPNYVSPFVSHDNFEDEFINPALWPTVQGGTETNLCKAPVGAGTLVFPNGGGSIESRELPSAEANGDSLVYHVRFYVASPVPKDSSAVAVAQCGTATSGSVSVQVTADGISWWDAGTPTYYSKGSGPVWADYDIGAPLKVRLVGASAGWLIDELWIGPATDHASGTATNLSANVTADYAFSQNATLVSFEYDATVDACAVGRVCPAPSEWRIILDGPADDGTYTPEKLEVTGRNLSTGRELQPAHGETLRHRVREAVLLDNVTAGMHNLAVAVRAPAGAASNWVVKVNQIQVLDRFDGDGDLVPDQLESTMCGREGVRDAFETIQRSLGHCEGTSYVPPAPTVPAAPLVEQRLFIAERTVRGPDSDNDTVPAYYDLEGYDIVLGTGAENVRTEPAEARRVILDMWDNDANLPLLTYHCVVVPAPLGIYTSGNADGDFVPDYVRVWMEEVCVDRRSGTPTVSREIAGYRDEPLDPDPTQPTPEVPVVDTGNILLYASVSEDADNDGIVGSIYYVYVTVRYDVYDRLRLIFSDPVVLTAVDEDDSDPDKPLTIPLRRDADEDYVPDAAEAEVCKWEDETTTLDGECALTGDYAPPMAYQLVMRTIYDSF